MSDPSVVALGYENTEGCYKRLSALTAQARRDGAFPALEDQTRRIEQVPSDDGPAAALRFTAEVYRRDRTEGQEYAIVVAVEKRTLIPLLRQGFDDFGVPIVALAGYSSQTLADDVAALVADDGRSSVLLIASDFDPTGEDIPRDFEQRTGCWDEVQRVALTDEQVAAYGLPENPGKATDSRAREFARRHGGLVQVELEALEPAQLIALYRDAFDEFWDVTQYDAVIAQEDEERDRLTELADRFDESDRR